jgi:hypothetical protein
LIDFGFCKSYIQYEQHIKLKKNSSLIGSKNYASIMSHKKFELSRRDDLESLGYMLIYFYTGSLPWNTISDEEIIINLKTNIVNAANYPSVLLDFLTNIRSMKFEETPNYYSIIDNFKREIELLSKNS